MVRMTLFLLVGCAGLAASAVAQTPPAEEPGRFQFNQVKEGFLRLDTGTGQVALCGQRAAGWTCETVPDDRLAFEGEIGRLQRENAALKRELLARGLELPGSVKPPAAKDEPPQAALPSDAELDRVMTFLEKAWRRLVDMMTTLQKDKRG